MQTPCHIWWITHASLNSLVCSIWTYDRTVIANLVDHSFPENFKNLNSQTILQIYSMGLLRKTPGVCFFKLSSDLNLGEFEKQYI